MRGRGDEGSRGRGEWEGVEGRRGRVEGSVAGMGIGLKEEWEG